VTQISKNPLPKHLETQMLSLFRLALVNIDSEKTAAELLDDLLSPTEKIMLGKRLSIAFLLDQGCDQRTIHTILHVSVTTVNNVNYWLQQKGNGYRRAIRMIRREEKWVKFFDKLESALRGFLSEKAWREQAHRL